MLQRGDFGMAIDCLRKLLDAHGKYILNPELGQILLNIGLCHLGIEDYSTGFEYFTRARGLFERTLGTMHPETANAILHQAFIRGKQGDTVEAIQYYNLAKTVLNAALGGEDSNIFQISVQLVHLYLSNGNTQDAISLMDELNQNCRKLSEEAAALIYNELGNVMRQHGFTQEALDYYATALTMFESTQGPDSLEVARVHINLAGLHLIASDIQKANLHLINAKSIKDQYYEESHFEMAVVFELFAELYVKQGRPYEARNMYTKTLAIYEASGSKKKGEIKQKLAMLRTMKK